MLTQLWSTRHPLLILQLGAILSGVIGIAANLITWEEIIDRPLAQYFKAQSDTAVFIVASFLTDFGKAQWFLIPALALFLAFRFVGRRPRWASHALFVFISVAASGLLADVLKVIFGRARPKLLFSNDVYQFFSFRLGADYYSFPSGHAVCAAAAGIALAVILPRYRVIWALLALLLISTRVITTAHYLSDAVAATVLAFITVFAVKAAFVRHGLDLSGDAASAAAAPVRSATAAKIIGKVWSGAHQDEESSLQTDNTQSMDRMLAIAALVVSVALVANLFAIEWYAAREHQQMLEWWLRLPLFLCLAFGTALGWHLYKNSTRTADAALVGESATVRGNSRLLRRLIRDLVDSTRRYGGGSDIEVSLQGLSLGLIAAAVIALWWSDWLRPVGPIAGLEPMRLVNIGLTLVLAVTGPVQWARTSRRFRHVEWLRVSAFVWAHRLAGLMYIPLIVLWDLVFETEDTSTAESALLEGLNKPLLVAIFLTSTVLFLKRPRALMRFYKPLKYIHIATSIVYVVQFFAEPLLGGKLR